MNNILLDVNYDNSQVNFLNEKFGCEKHEAKAMLKQYGLIPVLWALRKDVRCFEKIDVYFTDEKTLEALEHFKVLTLTEDTLFEHKIGSTFIDLDLNPFEGHICAAEVQSGQIFNGLGLDRFEPQQEVSPRLKPKK